MRDDLIDSVVYAVNSMAYAEYKRRQRLKRNLIISACLTICFAIITALKIWYW